MRYAMAALVALLAIIYWMGPRISRPTVPLGVSVPSDRIDDPVVLTAIARYRVITLVGSVMVVVVLLYPWQGVAAAIVIGGAMLVQLALALGAYVWTRKSIIRVKQAEGWYAGVPVRLSAKLTVSEAERETSEPGLEPQNGAMTWWPPAVAGLIVAVGAIIGAVQYESLPHRIGTHFDFSGHADSFADKSIWSVFGPLMVAAVLVIFLAGMGWVTSRQTSTSQPDGDATAARLRDRMNHQVTRSVLGWCNIVAAGSLTLMAIFTWHAVSGTPFQILGVAELVLPVVILVLVLRRLRTADVHQRDVLAQGAAQTTSRREVAPGEQAESPDDDQYWKWGIFYVNPNDPNFMVNKRFGVGVSVNFGHPGGKIFAVLILLLIVGPLVLPLVTR